MASITYDGRSFMLDGRRLWIVSGAVHYARLPRALWRDRIHAAKLAGLNTIETPVVWSRHEPRAGAFDFDGENDLRHFIELIRDAGMHAILRMGPYVGDGYDFGGLPAWLASSEGIAFRTHNPAFLEAASRFITAVAQKVRDLQVTAPRQGGPILLIQNESHWTCGHDDLATRYLGELGRYLREAGLNVPIINANNLWTDVEGEIDAWDGGEDMLAILRQLAAVRPANPRLVARFPVSSPERWGEEPSVGPSPLSLQRRLVQVLAAGGQFNIAPFAAGEHHGFSGGRLPLAGDAFVTQRIASDAPLNEAGAPSPAFHAIRKVATFASRFAKILSQIDPEFAPIALDPRPADAASKAQRQNNVSVVHARGAQGSVVYLFAPDPDEIGAAPKPLAAQLLLDDGSSLEVSTGHQGAVWCLFNVNLTPQARLDYCTFCALGQVGEVFVCYGAAGIEGHLSINGAPLTVSPAKGKQPVITEHEGVTVVVLSEEQADHAWLTDDAVFLNAGGVRIDFTPEPAGTVRQVMRISASGKVEDLTAPAAGRAPGKVTLEDWACAPADEYASGDSPRFASIDGPADLAELGAPYGYGWYRVRFAGSAAKRVKIIAPDTADRVQVILDNEPVGMIGVGPGVDDRAEFTLPVKKGDHNLVLLAENLGRASGGARLGEKKGVFGPLWEAKPFKIGKAQQQEGEPIDPLAFAEPVWDHRQGDATRPERVGWSFTHRRKAPLIFAFAPISARAVVVLNDKPLALMDRSSGLTLTLDQDTLNRGSNTIQLALLPDAPGAEEEVASFIKAASAALTVTEGVSDFAEKAEWAFAKWEQPGATEFETISKTAMAQRVGPTWWRATFIPPDTERPLYLDASGMTKGQLYVNGRHVGRYFVATRAGHAIAPQQAYLLPGVWLNPGEANELVLFDEHGGTPTKCKLTFGPPDGLRA